MPTPRTSDRAAETSTSIGGGAFVTSGALDGYQQLSEAFGATAEIYYGIVQQETGDWEIGIGTWTSSIATLTRDVVLASSAGGAVVAFPAGTKVVFSPSPADSGRRIKAQRIGDAALNLEAVAGHTAGMIRMDTPSTSGSYVLIQAWASGETVAPRMVMDMSGIRARRDGAIVAGRTAIAGCSLATAGEPTLALQLVDTATLLTADREAVFNAGTGRVYDSRAGTVTFIRRTDAPGNPNTDGLIRLSPIASVDAASVAGIMARVTAGAAAANLGAFIRVYDDVTSSAPIVVTYGGTATFVQRVRSNIGDFGDYYIGALDTGVENEDFISRKTGGAINFRSGLASTASIVGFRGSDNINCATIGPVGTSASNGQIVMTREKGDARFAPLSAARFKDQIAPANYTYLVGAFNALAAQAKTWVWGGETPEGSERRGHVGIGLIADTTVQVFPEAGVYQWQSGVDPETGQESDYAERRILGLDPLALIAMLIAKIDEQEARIAALEA